MPRGLRPEQVIDNPHLTLTYLQPYRLLLSSCDLQDPSDSCDQVKRVSFSNANGEWQAEKFTPPILPCAECPIARTQPSN